MGRKMELLAPAGDMECLKAAIAAGADAVYLGGKRYGARAFAGNFEEKELLEAIDLSHFFGVKVYLTVNTLTKDRELEELESWMRPFYRSGLDGVIVQDLGVLGRCRNAFPDLPLHASTQMTVTESSAALFLKRLGVSRIVPARELSLAELITLKQESGMELETFIHGALCYCYSGQCLFSSMLGGRSGNRGRCAQPCRQPYSIEEKGRRLTPEEYPLSLKDLCTLPFLPELIRGGIDSFKIEGRMKGPVYVAAVTAIYRKYLDLFETSPDNWSVQQKDLEVLNRLYVRGGSDGGYYHKHNARQMLTLTNPGYTGCDPAFLETVKTRFLSTEPSRPVSMTLTLTPGAPAVLCAACDGTAVTTKGMEVMEAVKKPLTQEDVRRQLVRTGGSHFHAAHLQIRLTDPCFLPVSALNDLRRKGLEALYEKMVRSGRRTRQAPLCAPVRSERAHKTIPASDALPFFVSVLTAEQAKAAVSHPAVQRLYLPSDVAKSQAEDGTLWEAIRSRKEKNRDFSLFLSLPVLLRLPSRNELQELAQWLTGTQEGAMTDGFLLSGLSGLCWAGRQNKKLSLNHSLYVFNQETLALYMRHFPIDSFTAPLELNRFEQRALDACFQERMVYGRIPMMISANCVKKTAGLCGQDRDKTAQTKMWFFLRDRYQAKFPVFVDCAHCMNTIYNSVPLSLHRHLSQIAQDGAGAFRLDFTGESPAQTAEILRLFAEKKQTVPYAYTVGHYKKGVS